MLAHALVPALRGRGHEVVALGRAALDVTDEAAVHARIAAERPDVVVQCAAYTAVDAAEADEAGAFRVNADATRYVAAACQRMGARLVYPSTDYVFPGDAARPYRPADPTGPINAYGRSKRAGEEAALRADGALVVRTSWLYGAGGTNFVDTMRRLARERDRLQVVDDQVGRPTWTGSLARTLAGLIEAGAAGIFHATGGGPYVSWYGFARRILKACSPEVIVEPVNSTAFPRPAPRPAHSGLDCTATERVLGAPMPDWRVALAEFLGVPADLGE